MRKLSAGAPVAAQEATMEALQNNERLAADRAKASAALLSSRLNTVLRPIYHGSCSRCVHCGKLDVWCASSPLQKLLLPDP